MSPDDLKHRERVIIDIAKKEKGEKTKPEEDVTQWHRTKRNLGPLQEGWYKQTTIPHVMWCYKTVAIKAKYFGIQSLVESLVRRQQEMIFRRSMQQMIVLMDEWDGLTLETIRQLEEEGKKRLDSLIQSKELSAEQVMVSSIMDRLQEQKAKTK